MERMFMEKFVLKSGADPQTVATAVTGARVSIASARRAVFIVNVGAGTTTTAHGFVLKQHDAASSGNSYDLAVSNPYYHKIAAATSFTKVTVDTDTSTYDLHSILAHDKAIVVFEVLAEQLRSDCKWVSLNVVAAGGTQAGTVAVAVDTDFKPAYGLVV